MRDDRNWTTYGDRLERVTAYIYDHLDDEIDLDKLAGIACLSAYHWHRIYHAVQGETIAATVKRLQAGALMLVPSPVIIVALHRQDPVRLGQMIADRPSDGFRAPCYARPMTCSRLIFAARRRRPV